MAASRNDSAVLGNDPTFKARVQAALLAACFNIKSEAASAVHRERVQFIHQVLVSPTSIGDAATKFAWAVATDATVLADATVGGTAVLTTGTVATQAALVTDAHIDTAIASQFNAFCQGIED